MWEFKRLGLIATRTSPLSDLLSSQYASSPTTPAHSCALDPRITTRLDSPSFPQVFSLAGSTFSLPSAHIFGTSMGAVNPLLTPAESSHTGK